MPLTLPKSIESQIRSHLEKGYPEEACGFLIGKPSKEVILVRPAENTKQETRGRRYLIDPKAFMEAEIAARVLKLDIVGIYHSHPDHPSKPSDFDRDHAWPWYSYVIVAVEKGVSKNLTSWVLTDDRTKFLEEEILSVD